MLLSCFLGVECEGVASVIVTSLFWFLPFGSNSHPLLYAFLTLFPFVSFDFVLPPFSCTFLGLVPALDRSFLLLSISFLPPV